MQTLLEDFLQSLHREHGGFCNLLRAAAVFPLYTGAGRCGSKRVVVFKEILRAKRCHYEIKSFSLERDFNFGWRRGGRAGLVVVASADDHFIQRRAVDVDRGDVWPAPRLARCEVADDAAPAGFDLAGHE
jgi:hypothetical protein